MAVFDAFCLGLQFNETGVKDAFALGAQLNDIGTTATITVTSPTRYETYQQNGSSQYSFTITGTYTGTPASIEASFNGGSYATIVASPSGGTFSGTLSNQAAGQGTLTVRFTDDTSISTTVLDVGIGEVFVILSDSVGVGVGTNPQSYSHATLKATNIYQGGSWKLCNDPTNASGSANGSQWPLLATHIMTSRSVPVAFINLAVGSADIAGNNNGWASGQTTYNSIKAVFAAIGHSVRGVLCHFGPNAIVASSTLSQATYNAAIDSWITAVQTDFQASVKCLWAICGEVGTGSPPDRTAAQNNIRAAIIEAWGDNASCLPGPVLIDQNYADDVHPSTDAQLQAVADRWWFCIEQAFYSGTTARGPRLSSARENANRTSVTLTFDSTLRTGQTFTTSAFKVYDNGTPVTISSVSYAGSTSVVLVLSAALSGSCTVSLGDDDSAVGATLTAGPARTLPGSAGTIYQPPEPFYVQAASQYTSGGSGSRGRLVNAGA